MPTGERRPSSSARSAKKEQLLRLGNANTVTQQYTLPSPVDGEVLLRNITPGVEVQGQYSGGATVELYTIGELDKVWVLGDLYEMDIARVKVGVPAQVTVVAYPGKVFAGKVDWVSGSLDPNTRTAKVRCTFDNPEKLLRPLMYATVQISVDQESALAIPRNALLRLGEDKSVFLEIGEDKGYVRFKRVVVDVDEGRGEPMAHRPHGTGARTEARHQWRDLAIPELLRRMAATAAPRRREREATASLWPSRMRCAPRPCTPSDRDRPHGHGPAAHRRRARP